ncbi:MAG: YbhB/YbcL family Raf kinase inhibitor-like protein [Methylocystaceae bacterium]|nr:MAG: YbhB/YbcL family Raf kinase inhibitor-like protein [Methylocystaceae bacterium]
MRLQSPAFADGAPIPRRFTCDGDDLSPALEWSDAPEKAKSFVLLCDDPDAPAGIWRHWAVYDIPPDWTRLEEGAGRPGPGRGFKQGINDFHKSGYGGPCPPRGHGVHHYRFRLLALGVSALPAPRVDPTCEEVEREARKVLLAEAISIGTYRR